VASSGFTARGCARPGPTTVAADDRADAFLIRGTRYNQGVLLKDLPAQGADAIGDPTQAHMVAIDARAPLYDGGICARVDCVSLGIVVNRDGERVVRMAGDHNAACQPGASTTPCSTTAPPPGCRLPRRTGRGRSTCRPSSAARCGPGSPSPASGSRSMCARRCACPARRDPPCSLTAR
jgi:hypothetical protein